MEHRIKGESTEEKISTHRIKNRITIYMVMRFFFLEFNMYYFIIDLMRIHHEGVQSYESQFSRALVPQ